MWPIAILVCMAAVSLGDDPPPCPSNDDIYPCSCYSDSFLTSISCEKFNGLHKLEPVLKNTLGQNMSFAFWHSNFGDIPSDLFEGHKSVYLHFDKCLIGSFGDKPFTGLEDSLKNIFIYGSVSKLRKDLASFPLSHLRKLESLSFQANDIIRLGNDWFESGPESLTELNLEANDIEELGDRAFASLVNVEQIWLGENRLKTVSRSMFPRPANELEILEISFNEIEELPADMFEGFPSLHTVNLAGNKLKSILESIWGNIWPQLEKVYIEENDGFVCTEELKWIYRQELPYIFRGTCGYGNDLYENNLEDLTLEDFQ